MTKKVYEDHRKRGKALYLEGKFEKAMAEYQLALRLHRPAVDADDINLVHCSLSACQAALGHYDEAIAEAEIAIAMKPASPKGFYRKAEALIGAKRYDEAKTVYEQCLHTLPVSVSFLTFLTQNQEYGRGDKGDFECQDYSCQSLGLRGQ
jgi:tetratricopeptide (TPR) repeat protein